MGYLFARSSLSPGWVQRNYLRRYSTFCGSPPENVQPHLCLVTKPHIPLTFDTNYQEFSRTSARSQAPDASFRVKYTSRPHRHSAASAPNSQNTTVSCLSPPAPGSNLPPTTSHRAAYPVYMCSRSCRSYPRVNHCLQLRFVIREASDPPTYLGYSD